MDKKEIVDRLEEMLLRNKQKKANKLTPKDVFDLKYIIKQLSITSVIPMLPKIKSNEFESYLKNSGYERIDDELLQKGTDYYCVNNVYRHFLNLIEFGN